MGHIYQIRNTKNNAVYIGSVLKRDPEHRWHRHKTDLRGGHHHSKHLQNAWNKYGESHFVFEILETVDGDVLQREQCYLDNRKNNFPSNLNYNVLWIAGNCSGRVWSTEMRKKLSVAHLGQKQTPQARDKQIETWKKKCNTFYSFTSPDGTVYDNVKNLREFTRQHPELDVNTLRLLHKEKIQYCNGWSKTGVTLPLYELISPTGISTKGMLLKKLCVDANINYKMVHKYCIKQSKHYNGWMAKKLA